MLNFLKNIHIDRLSFWLGFLGATLFWWLLGRYRYMLRDAFKAIRKNIQASGQDRQLDSTIRHANDVMRRAQHMHLAEPLFSLDEIILPPRVLAPPPRIEPGANLPTADITDDLVPYLPDWPELASVYRAPTLSLPEALQGGANLALIGQPGSGKSVALAHLALLVARHDPQCGPLANFVPVLLHIGDLNLAPEEAADALTILAKAAAGRASAQVAGQLPAILKKASDQGRLLLLLDGLDELSPEELNEAARYLDRLLQQVPQLRGVVAADPGNFGGLTRLGFTPVALSAWTAAQRQAFLIQWSRLWEKHIQPMLAEPEDSAEPLLIGGWLQSDQSSYTPLELTLKAWATYAGDSLGPTAMDAIEAYVRRMSVNVAQARPAMEQLAVRSILEMHPVMSRKEAEEWVSQFEQAARPGETETTTAGGTLSEAEADFAADETDKPQPQEKRKGKSKDKQPPAPISTSRLLPKLVSAGLLANRAGGRFTFSHPLIAGYLAGCAAQQSSAEQLLEQPDWAGKWMALHFLAGRDSLALWTGRLMEISGDDLLARNLFAAARWLRDAPPRSAWSAGMLRQLATLLQNEALPANLWARALTALAFSNASGTSVLMRKYLSADQPGLRALCALGLGILRDQRAVPDLVQMVADKSPLVQRAACLALVAVGDKDSLEAVASALLNGDDALRQAAAEALANHPEEGHPTLAEAAVLDDVRVRRAAVAGLARVGQPWAIEILQKMQVDDQQWVAQNAATQALEHLFETSLRAPRPLQPLPDTPWLIQFAGKLGMGVLPGKPAMDLLLRALREGDDEQKLATLYYFSQKSEEGALQYIYPLYLGGEGDLREAAAITLWHMASAGMPLPHPQKFGLKTL